MTVPTGSKPTDPPDRPDPSGQPGHPGETDPLDPPKQPYVWRRSRYAVKLKEHVSLEEVRLQAPEGHPWSLWVLAAIIGLALLGIYFSAPPHEAAVAPSAAATQAQGSERGVALPNPLPEGPERPVPHPTYRRLTDKDLREQLPPQSTIVE
jgi:hypothetical protein